MLRLILFLGIVTTALASVTLDSLDSAARSFSIAIDQQWTIAQSDPSPAALAENTIAYADAKISYYTALREAMPELANIATGREHRPPDVGKLRDAFEPAGTLQEIAAEKRQRLYYDGTARFPAFRKRPRNSTRRIKSKSGSLRISRDKTLPKRRFTMSTRSV
jgi:hypothetical protein